MTQDIKTPDIKTPDIKTPAPVKALFTQDEYPANLPAAALDALEWLRLFSKLFSKSGALTYYDVPVDSSDRLRRCIVTLESFLSDALPLEWIPGDPNTLLELYREAGATIPLGTDPRLKEKLKDARKRNPDLAFSMTDTTIYWRCDDGFEYGVYSLAYRTRQPGDPENAPITSIARIWDGETSLLWREWAGLEQVALMRWEDDGGAWPS